MRGAALARKLIRPLGVDLVRYHEVPTDFSPQDAEILRRVSPYTLTTPERIWAAANAARYVVRANIPGDIMECGTWRGGSLMAMALGLLDEGARDRGIWGFDTFAGMTRPEEVDVDLTGMTAAEEFERTATGDDSSTWCAASEDDVRDNVLKTGYPADRVQLVAGKVEDTIPHEALGQIALLRLDTDWYQSTRHEMEHLWPRLSPGGVLIVDDYGHWQGSRKAVDEYFESNGITLLMTRTDYTGRMMVKPG